MPGLDQLFTGEPEGRSDDELAGIVRLIEDAIDRNDFHAAATLVEENIAATWFGFHPSELPRILGRIAQRVGTSAPLLTAAYNILTATTAGEANTQTLRDGLNREDPRQLFVLAMFRMGNYRSHGQTTKAMAQADLIETYLAQMRPGLNPRGGWLLQGALQVADTAILAGDFTRALTALSLAQMRSADAAYAFLERDAFVKSALIHAAFGNSFTAQSLLKRSIHVPRTSSWVEHHIDAHFEFASVLSASDNLEVAIDRLENVSLHEIGEMWPFYIVALHRLFEAAGYHDELDHRLEMLDQLPLPRIDGEGFSGSIIPLKRALVALSAGRGSDALDHLARTDQSLPYTKLFLATADLHAGRLNEALETALGLAKHTRGFRLQDIRRLSVLAAAQYMLGEHADAIETLSAVADVPRGLSSHELIFFGTEMQQFAKQHVPNWPQNPNTQVAVFLPELPWRRDTLTDREVRILELLAQGFSRTQIADELFISVSTVKTQLQSLYRKLDATSAAEAISEGERRRVI